jgi:EmrB/QacA subfamily drug resistance transporter
VFVIGLLGFGIASGIAGLAPNQAMLFGARAVQGMFGALMAPAALSLLTVTFTEARERARAFGVYGAIAGGGAALGLVLGGVLTQYASWRWTLLINVPIAIMAAIAATLVIRESKVETRHGYDIPGALTSTVGLFLLVYGFTMVASHGWGSLLTVSLLGGGVVFLAGFVLIEMRSTHPLLPLKVVLERKRGGSFLASLLVGMAMLGTFLFLTYFLQGTLGYSALKTGFAFLPFSAGIILGAGIASRFLPRTGPRSLLVTGLTLATLGLLWFSRLTPSSSYVSHVLVGEILVSIGMGITFVPMNSTSLFGVAEEHAGVASALVNTTQQVGGALGTALLNTIAASATVSYLALRVHNATTRSAGAVHGYTTAFEVSAALVAMAAVVAGLLIGGKHQHTDESLEVTASSATLAPEFALE